MNILEVKLNKEQIAILNGTNVIQQDKAKGKAIEELCKQVLYQLGANEVFDCVELEDQIETGDLKALIRDFDDKLNVVDNIFYIECKSSHTYRNIHKLAFDIKYIDKYDFNKDYIQTTTNSSLGWIYFTQADWIMCYNCEGGILHIIQNYQELKKNVLKKIDKYVEKWTTIDGFRGWYLRNNNNPIDGYSLEGSVKEDSNKYTLVANLMIENKTISRYGGQLSSYKIKLIEEKEKNTLSDQTRVF